MTDEKKINDILNGWRNSLTKLPAYIQIVNYFNNESNCIIIKLETTRKHC